MDLYAYAQIDDISAVAKANGIEVPRLRGYRLMKDELPQDYTEALNNVAAACCKDLCRAVPFWTCDPWVVAYCSRADRLIGRYCPNDRVQWDKIHGKRRKTLKFAIKQHKKRIVQQMETFNKYAGRDDVLYIHARIGGANWINFGGLELAAQPWFLEKVDDFFDNTYCDIYAKIEAVPDDV